MRNNKVRNDQWGYLDGVALDFIKPVNPTDIALIEPFLPVGTDRKQIKEPLLHNQSLSPSPFSPVLRPRWST